MSDDLAYVRTEIVNVYLYGEPGAGDGEWVLIDAGLALLGATVLAGGVAGALRRR